MMSVNEIALLNPIWLFAYVLLMIVGIWYVSFVIWGLYKLARAKKPVLFVLGFFINIIAFISAFFKLKPKK